MFSTSLGMILAEMVLASSLAVGSVALAAIVTGRIGFRHRAATRHAVLLVGLGWILLIPVVSVLLSLNGVRLVTLPLFGRAADNVSEARPASADLSAKFDSVDTHPRANLPAEPQPGRADATPAFSLSEPATAIPNNSTPRQGGNPANSVRVPFWVAAVGLVWLAGSCGLLVQLLRTWFGVSRLRNRLQIFDQSLVRSWFGTFCGDDALPVVAEADVPVPMAVGVVRPVIVLPRGLRGHLTADELCDVLGHECAHIRRHDNFVLLLEAFARIAFWPVVTLHLLLRDLSVAREDACDNRVLARRDPLAYGETLLRLGELCLPTARLALTADALRRGERLDLRVARILDPRREISALVSRRWVSLAAVVLVLLAIPFCGLRLVAETAESEQEARAAQLKALLVRLDQTNQSIRNLAVTTDYVKHQLFLLPVDKPVEMQLTTTAVIDSAGHARNDTTGQQVNIEPDGKSVRLYRGRWVNAFKNGEARHATWYEGNPSSASIDETLTWHGIDPREFTSHYQNKTVVERIQERGGEITGQAVWDKRPVVIVETTPVGQGELRRYRFYVDPERAVVVRRSVAIRFKPDQPWQDYARIECFDYREVAPTIWLPTRVKYESVEVTPELTPEKLSWSYEGKNRDWQVNQKLAEGTFDLEFPAGVRVTDRRTPKPIPKPDPEAALQDKRYFRGQDALLAIESLQPVWSPSQLGVELGLAHGGTQRTFAGGERVPLVLFVRNVGKKGLRVELTADFLGNVPDLRNERGEAVSVESVVARGLIARYRETLQPGEAFGLRHAGLGLGRNPRPGEQNWFPFWSKPANGTFRLTHSHSISVEPLDGSQPSQEGKFRTPPVAFAVVLDKAVQAAPVEKPAFSDAVTNLLDRAKKARRGPFRGRASRTNAEGQIDALWLREFEMQPGDAAAMGELTQLVELNLSHSNVTDDDLAQLTALTKLRELNLWKTAVGDEGAAHLGKLTSLESLHLGDTRITDTGVPRLAELPALRVLDLARTRVTDTGIKSLQGCKSLSSLKLSETAITDAAIPVLENIPTLRGVTLDETQVTEDGLARLAKRKDFSWMESDEAVVQEFARRQSAGDWVGVEAMLSIALDMPSRGKFNTRSVTPHSVTERDKERQRKRFRVEWDWTLDGKDQGLFAEISVRQASVRVMEQGLLEKSKPAKKP